MCSGIDPLTHKVTQFFRLLLIAPYNLWSHHLLSLAFKQVNLRRIVDISLSPLPFNKCPKQEDKIDPDWFGCIEYCIVLYDTVARVCTLATYYGYESGITLRSEIL